MKITNIAPFLFFPPSSLCGVLVFDSVSRSSSASSSSRSAVSPSLSHSIFQTQLCRTLSFTHTTLSHTFFHTRTTLSHTIFHTQLCHTLSFTHNLVTHYLSQTTLSHTIFVISFTHNSVTNCLSHTTLSHIIFVTHTQRCCTPSFTHNFVTHCLSHKFVTHDLCHTQLCHTLSFTLNFVTHTHTFVTHHLSHATLSHTPLSHTIFRTQVAKQFCHTLALGVAGVALGDMEVAFAWQAWHFTRSTFVLGFRYIWHWAGSWRAWFALVAWGAALLCVAGVVYLATWTVHLRGRRGTWRHGSSICVAGVALGDIHLHFGMAGEALAHSNPRFACVGRPGRRGTLRGRCGIWRQTIHLRARYGTATWT